MSKQLRYLVGRTWIPKKRGVFETLTTNQIADETSESGVRETIRAADIRFRSVKASSSLASSHVSSLVSGTGGVALRSTPLRPSLLHRSFHQPRSLPPHPLTSVPPNRTFNFTQRTSPPNLPILSAPRPCVLNTSDIRVCSSDERLTAEAKAPIPLSSSSSPPTTARERGRTPPVAAPICENGVQERVAPLRLGRASHSRRAVKPETCSSRYLSRPGGLDSLTALSACLPFHPNTCPRTLSRCFSLVLAPALAQSTT